MQKYSDSILNKNGKPVAGALITVTTYPGNVPATIYAADGGQPVASVTSDENGRFAFYAVDGHYNLRITGKGIEPIVISDIALNDPSNEPSLGDLAAADGAERIGNNGKTVAQRLLELSQSAAGLMSAPDLMAGRKLRIVAGTMRNVAGTWSYIADTEHTPLGSVSVNVSGDYLVTNYGFTATRVVSMIGTTDESFASKGVTLGPSVGLSFSNWMLYKPFSCWVYKQGGGAGFAFQDIDAWFGPGEDTTLSTTADGSSFTIVHKQSAADDVPVATVFTSSTASQAVGSNVRLTYGPTSVTATAFEDFAGYIRFDGSAWVVETPNVAKPTMAFAGGVLTVTHEDLGAETRGLTVTPVGGVLVPSSGSTVSGTQFQIVFNAFGGAAQNTPNTDMRFRYHRPRQVQSVAPVGMRVAIRRGPVVLSPQRVASISGNIWFSGLMETNALDEA